MKIQRILMQLCAAFTAGALISGCSRIQATQEPQQPQVYFYMNNGSVGKDSNSTPKGIELAQQEITKKSGIQPVLVGLDKGSNTERLNVILAAGSRVDAFWGNWQDYSKDDMIIPLNSLLEQYGQDIIDRIEPDEWKSMTDSAGNIWGIPRVGYMVGNPTYVRGDWLEEYGLPVPQTLEQLEEAMEAFKKNDPAGGGTTIPLMVRYDGIRKAVSVAFTGKGYGLWLDESDGRMKPMELHPKYRDMVSRLNQWYNKGYIRKDSFSLTSNQITEYIKQGKIGIYMEWYSQITKNMKQFQKNIPGGTYKIAPWRTEMGYGTSVLKAEQEGMLIHKACANPEDVIKLVNWAYQSKDHYYITMGGIKGVQWDYLDDTETSIDSIGDADSLYYGDFAFALGDMELYVLEGAKKYENAHSEYLANKLRDFSNAQKGDDYDFYYDSSALKQNVPGAADMHSYIEEQIIGFITGLRPIEEYDKFITELYDMGMDQYIDECTSQYTRQKQ